MGVTHSRQWRGHRSSNLTPFHLVAPSMCSVSSQEGGGRWGGVGVESSRAGQPLPEATERPGVTPPGRGWGRRAPWSRKGDSRSTVLLRLAPTSHLNWPARLPRSHRERAGGGGETQEPPCASWGPGVLQLGGPTAPRRGGCPRVPGREGALTMVNRGGGSHVESGSRVSVRTAELQCRRTALYAGGGPALTPAGVGIRQATPGRRYLGGATAAPLPGPACSASHL